MIGRKKERQALGRAFKSPRSEFVAVYGRRRVGKTYLIRQTFADDLCFMHTGLEKGGMSEQLRAFKSSLVDAGLDSVPPLHNWFDAFDALKKVVSLSPLPRKVLFIDELPWMDTAKSCFLDAFGFFWNNWASARSDILLVICGSATSWILDKVIKSRGGLHDRVTEQILVQPFKLRECRDYASELGLRLSDSELAEAYMALGGIPYYWSLMDSGLGLAQNMNRLFFAPDARLRLEYSQLYDSLFKRPGLYIAIVEALALKSKGLSREDLMEICDLPDTGRLTKILEELEQCGFIRRYRPFGQKKKGYLCQLIDNFTLFQHRFVTSNLKHDPTYWTSSYGKPFQRIWSGLAFERLCLEHVDEIRRALGISGVVSGVCTWRGRHAQVDLLIDRDDGVINLCEMKYRESPYVVEKDDDAELRQRRDTFISETQCRKGVHLTLVTTVGLAETKYSGVFQSVVTLSDLLS